jgi:hypothetical protein
MGHCERDDTPVPVRIKTRGSAFQAEKMKRALQQECAAGSADDPTRHRRQTQDVIAGLDPAIPIMWHGRAFPSGMAGSSLACPGDDDLVARSARGPPTVTRERLDKLARPE